MTTNTKEAESRARAKAHELLTCGGMVAGATCGDHGPGLQSGCDRITAELLSRAAALDELRADRDVAVSVAWNLRRDLAAAIAERDRLREQLEEADTLIGDLQSGYSFTDHDARSMSAWRADRALKATRETSPTPASKGPTK